MPRPSRKLRILVADDHELVRRGIRGLLTAKLKCRVVGEARDGAEAIVQAECLQPDIVILDIDMPNLSGLDAAPRIREVAPQSRIIVLTLHESREMVARALDAGAQGLVLKSDVAQRLVTAVRQVSRDKRFQTSKVSVLVSRDLLQPPNGDGREFRSRVKPTARQREVIRLLSAGKANKEIAVTLGISVRTAEMHRANLMKKLGLHSLAELVHYAIRAGLINPDSLDAANTSTFVA